jgi:hypothetical protein
MAVHNTGAFLCGNGVTVASGGGIPAGPVTV